MSHSDPGAPAQDLAEDVFGMLLFRLSRAFALAGGLVLLALTLMSVASVALRSLGAKPVPGDFELVQLGCAVAVSLFLPWCQMRGGHVIVDFFTLHLTTKRAALDALGAGLLGLCAALIAWRLGLGLWSARESGESTMILSVPVWWAFVPMVPSFALLALTGLHAAWGCLREAKAS
jgi:TRAP-type C4-dicarboxylate transport system permease small subunit